MTSGSLRGLLSVLSLQIEPVGTVIGAGVYQLYRPTGCWGLGPTRSTGVYANYVEGLRGAWRTVVSRLEQEAVRVGAHGVLGVTVSQGWVGTGSASTYQLQLTGSAVRVPHKPPLSAPFLSTLSMPEYLKLLMGGWTPRGIVWGVAAAHVHAWEARPIQKKALLSNMEMEEPTRAMHRVRWSLDQDARATLRQLGGAGAVKMSVTLDRSSQQCPGSPMKGGQPAAGPGVLIEGRIVGTAVVRFRPPLEGPTLTVPLESGASNGG